MIISFYTILEDCNYHEIISKYKLNFVISFIQNKIGHCYLSFHLVELHHPVFERKELVSAFFMQIVYDEDECKEDRPRQATFFPHRTIFIIHTEKIYIILVMSLI